MKDIEFRYKSQKYKGKIQEPEIYMNIGFYVVTEDDKAYLCQLEKKEEGWDLDIYYTGIYCHLSYLDNYQSNSRKISGLLGNSEDGSAIAKAIKEVYIKSKSIII